MILANSSGSSFEKELMKNIFKSWQKKMIYLKAYLKLL